MGEHKGWRIRKDVRRGTWRAEVLIPGTGKYRSQTFKGSRAEPEARAWAKTEASGIVLGRPSPQMQGAVRVSTKDVHDAFIERMTAIGRAPSYIKDLRVMLSSFITAVPVLDSPNAPGQVEKWLGSLVSSGKGRGGAVIKIGAARRNKYLVSARTMCNWAIKKEKIVEDPTRQEDIAKVIRYLKPQFSLEEMRIIVRHKDSQSHRWILLMLYAGLRRDEARCLRWQDIDWEGGSIQIVMDSGACIKRDKERIVALQPELRHRLYPLRKATGRIAQLGAGNMRRAFNSLMFTLKLPIAGRSPHSCRYSYAGLMAATGVSSFVIRGYLGHESEKTTQGYAALASKHVEGVKNWKRGEFSLIKA